MAAAWRALACVLAALLLLAAGPAAAQKKPAQK